MTETSRIAIEAERLALVGKPCALATIVAASGSTYRRAGASLLVEKSGTMHGAISGGCLDADLLEHARQVMSSGTPKIVDYRSADDDTLFGVAMGCGGDLRILVEPVDAALLASLRFATANDRSDLVAYVESSPRLATRFVTSEAFATLDPATVQWARRLPAAREVVLFGAGPEAAPFCEIAARLGWRVTLCDHRGALLEGRFPEAETILAPVGELIDKASPAPAAAVVVMMHNLPHDLTLLRALVSRRLAYLGVLGPKKRTEGLLETLRGEGLDAGAGGSPLHAPTGLALGAETPAEIALSIASEIQAVFTASGGGFLRDKRGPIHDRKDEVEGGDAEGRLPSLGVPVAILAAGGASRMGEAKQILDVGGESMLRRAVRTAIESRCGEVVVVLGARRADTDRELAGLPVRVVENLEWKSGIASSIGAAVGAVEALGGQAIVLALADQPFVGAAHLRRLATTLRAGTARIVASAYPQGGGVPAAFDRELFGELRALRGDAGARDLIRRLPALTVEIPLENPADVDTPADYEKLRGSCPTS